MIFALGFVEAEEDFRFFEEGGLGGVDVFAGIFVLDQLTTGEGDDVAHGVVVDGEHEAVAESEGKVRRAGLLSSLAEAMPVPQSSRPLKPSCLAQSRKSLGLPGIQPTSQRSAISLP